MAVGQGLRLSEGGGEIEDRRSVRAEEIEHIQRPSAQIKLSVGFFRHWRFNERNSPMVVVVLTVPALTSTGSAATCSAAIASKATGSAVTCSVVTGAGTTGSAAASS